MKKLFVLTFALLTINIADAQWVQTSLDSVGVSKIFINGDDIFAGTDHGVYLSSDNGSSWANINNGIPYGYSVLSFAVNGSNIFASLCCGGGIYVSTNNGSSWTSTSTIPGVTNINALAFQGSILFAGDNFDGIYLSSDNGNSWASSNTGLADSNVNAITINGNNTFVGTWSGGVFISSNNGNNWTATSFIPNVKTLAVSGNTIFAGTEGGALVSSNNGNTWVSSDLSGYVYSFATSGNNIFAVTWSTGVFLSTNNGINWTAVNSTLTETNYMQSIAINDNYIFAGSASKGVFRRPLSEILGINESTFNNKVSVYPNPAKEILTIETNNINTEQRLEIINLVGQTVYTNIINKKATINTSAFVSGVYILKLYTDKETVVKKFVKE